MKTSHRLWIVVAMAGMALGLGACDGKPFEKAGKAVDRAAEKTGEKLRELTK